MWSFSELLEKTNAFKARIPFLRDLHLNFILLHYCYIISLSFITSIIIYPGNKLAYIDALFFSAGAATQSGLNTVDLNLLHTYQQVILYFVSMLSTPIFIHTALVFIRLYWFEKRFQHVVRDARNLRGTRTRMRTVTEDKEEDGRDQDSEERGIGNRPIVVMRNEAGDALTKWPQQGSPVNTPDDDSDPPRSPTDTRQEESNNQDTNRSTTNESTDVQDHAPRPTLGLGLGNLRVPSQVSPEHHIAFLENQRKSKGALRIPSPREYDRGGVPEVLEEEEEEEEEGDGATKRSRRSNDGKRRSEDGEAEDNVPPMEGPHITINEPEMVRTKTRQSTFPRMDSRPTVRETKDGNETGPMGRARRGTLNSIAQSLTQERDRPTLPYLSWDATVGRNSNFVDLTEEQRDELGGIEYRALKTLAVVLIAYYVLFHLLGIVCLVPWI